MALESIQYCIAGSVKSSDGFGTICSYGYYPNETIDRMDKWQLGETQVYWLHHNEKYVSYSLRENRILPLGSSRGASFTFNLRISTDKQLENNVSPFTMLKDMYDSFMGEFMTTTLDGVRFTPKSSQEINNSEKVSKFVEKVLGKYQIGNRVGAFPEPMNPDGKTGILKLPKEKLEDFFRDTCYHEFSNFCNIEIGSACETSPELVGVLDNIPRVKTYSIWVREENKEYEKTGKILSSTNPDTYCSATLPASDTKEYPTVRFSLNKLLSAKDNRITEQDGSIVELLNGRINCTLVSQKINYKVFVEVEGFSRDVNSFKNSSQAKITVNDEPVNLPLAYSRGFEMSSTSVIDAKVAIVSPSGIKASVKSKNEDKWKKTLTISISVEKEQQTSIQSPFTPVRKRVEREESEESNGQVIELNDKIKAQDDEIKSLKSQRIIYGLVGIAAGLILCGAAWLVFWLMSDNVVDARQQVLAYANCNQNQWQSLAEKDGLLELKDLISNLKNKDKVAAEIYFNFDKIDSLKNDIDSDKVKQYKSHNKFSDWKSFCEASDAIRRMKKVKSNPLPNNNIVTHESKKTVLELLSQDTPSNKIDDYKQCDDWDSIDKETKAYLEYLLNNQKLKKISNLEELREQAVKVAQEKLRSEINKEIPGYCNKSGDEIAKINKTLIKKMSQECKIIANATSVVDNLFPITDPNGVKQREMCSIVGTYKNAKNQTHFNSWSEITKASQKKKKTEK